MLFHDAQNLAISQPAHAWLSGQLMRAWAERLPEPVLLAAEQHDIGWLDWETSPSFDAAAGRPHLFRHVGARLHAPMWARGVERALGAWGRHVALLVSRHGSLIYTRFTDRGRMEAADAEATEHYLSSQAARQAGWARALGLDAEALALQTGFVAFSDTLSLALCGELRVPLTLDIPGHEGIRLDRVEGDGGTEAFTLHPWPFAGPALALEIEARPLPPGGRFADEGEMRAWFAGPERAALRVRLSPGQAGTAAPVRGFPQPAQG